MVRLKHIFNYLSIGVASKLPILFSIFIYSRILDVESYGVLNIYYSYISIFVILFSLNLHTAIGRYIYNDVEDFSEFYSTTIIAISSIYILITLVFFTQLEFFSTLLNLSDYIVVALILVLPSYILESIITQVSIYKEESYFLLKLILIKSLSTFIIGICLFFSLADIGVYAFILAELITSSFFSFYILFKLSAKWVFTYSFGHFKYILNYALPLIPYMLSSTLLSQSDRIFIDKYFGKTEVGLYSLVYNASIFVVIIISSLLNSVNPSYYKSLSEKKFNIVKNQSNNLFIISMLITLFVVLFGIDFFKLFTDIKYESTLDLIPIIAVGGMCSAVFQISVRIFAYINKTYIISLIATCATLINISLNFFFLPHYGYKFAAYSTLVAYFVMGFITILLSNRYFPQIKNTTLDKMGYLLLLFFLTLIIPKMAVSYNIQILIKILVLTITIILHRNIVISFFNKRGI